MVTRGLTKEYGEVGCDLPEVVAASKRKVELLARVAAGLRCSPLDGIAGAQARPSVAYVPNLG
jgi:hypothetical protein